MRLRIIQPKGENLLTEETLNVLSIEDNDDFGIVITYKESDGSINKRELEIKNFLYSDILFICKEK